MVPEAGEAVRKILVLMGADRLGRGDDLLGAKLMGNFIATLKEMGPELWCVVLVNAGVKLAVAGSEVLAGLQAPGASRGQAPGVRHLPQPF